MRSIARLDRTRWLYWALIATNLIVPQALWSARVRSSTIAIFMIAISVNVGMWLERFVIVVTSLHRDFLPSSWGMYYPTIWDWATYAGTIGLFVMLFFRLHSLASHDFDLRNETNHRQAGGRRRMKTKSLLYGFLAEFDGSGDAEAVHPPRAAGGFQTHRCLHAVSGGRTVAKSLAQHHSIVPLIVLIGGIAGGLGGAFMQWYSSVYRLSTEYRRPAVQQLAVVRGDRI